MSCNKHRPHLLVLPEDDANARIARDFQLALDDSVFRTMQVLPPAGGWGKVLDDFESDHLADLDRYPARRMLLLIDFDSDHGRLTKARSRIPDRLTNRVFILGVWTEPEKLKPDLGSCETIGAALAQDCRNDTSAIWDHELLRHNADEIDRMRQHVRPILFEP